jgi:hypothetical protein
MTEVPNLEQVTITPAPQETVTNPRDAFLTALPEEYRADPVFGNFNSVNDLAKSYKSAATLVGMDKNYVLPLPKEDTPEAWAPIWDKLGRPESADKYEISAPEGVQFDDGMTAKLKEVAHANGISAKAFKALAEVYGSEQAGMISTMTAQSEQQVTEWKTQLKSEFGEAYDDKISLAQEAVAKFGGDEAKEFFAKNPQFGNNPLFVKMFANLGSQIQGDTIPSQSVGNTSGRLTPAEAQMEIAKMNADPDVFKSMYDNKHPMHKANLERRQKLFEAANAGK